MKAVLTVEELRALVTVKTQKDVIPVSFLSSGIPQGAITSISGLGKTELVLKFLSEHPDFKVAWIEEHFSVFPFGFVQKKISLDRVLFVDAEDEIFWVTLQVIRAQIFQVIVFYCSECDLNTLRKIQLEAEKSNVITIWLTSDPPALWPVSLQLQAEQTPSGTKASVLKQRY